LYSADGDLGNSKSSFWGKRVFVNALAQLLQRKTANKL
jgi:hypothetical protein